MAKTFRGQTVRLATHAIGARVVQTALDTLPVASAALIKVSTVGSSRPCGGKGGAGVPSVSPLCCLLLSPGKESCDFSAGEGGGTRVGCASVDVPVSKFSCGGEVPGLSSSAAPAMG